MVYERSYEKSNVQTAEVDASVPGSQMSESFLYLNGCDRYGRRYEIKPTSAEPVTVVTEDGARNVRFETTRDEDAITRIEEQVRVLDKKMEVMKERERRADISGDGMSDQQRAMKRKYEALEEQRAQLEGERRAAAGEVVGTLAYQDGQFALLRHGNSVHTALGSHPVPAQRIPLFEEGTNVLVGVDAAGHFGSRVVIESVAQLLESSRGSLNSLMVRVAGQYGEKETEIEPSFYLRLVPENGAVAAYCHTISVEGTPQPAKMSVGSLKERTDTNGLPAVPGKNGYHMPYTEMVAAANTSRVSAEYSGNGKGIEVGAPQSSLSPESLTVMSLENSSELLAQAIEGKQEGRNGALKTERVSVLAKYDETNGRAEVAILGLRNEEARALFGIDSSDEQSSIRQPGETLVTWSDESGDSIPKVLRGSDEKRNSGTLYYHASRQPDAEVGRIDYILNRSDDGYIIRLTGSPTVINSYLDSRTECFIPDR